MHPTPSPQNDKNDKVGFQVKVTLWFWLMYPPPGIEKLKQVQVTSTSDVPPPPKNDKVGFQVTVTLWFWLMYPHPKNDKVGFQVKVTLWFWLMYPPPPRFEKLKQVQATSTSDAPPPMIEINTNAIENNWGQQVHFTNLPPLSLHTYIFSLWNTLKRKHQFFKFSWNFSVNMTLWFWLMYSPPPPKYDYLILCLNRKLVNFNFKWIWIYGLEPHPTPPLQPKKMKCSFLDYIQLLMIGWAGQWTRTPSATPLQPKK